MGNLFKQVENAWINVFQHVFDTSLGIYSQAVKANLELLGLKTPSGKSSRSRSEL